MESQDTAPQVKVIDTSATLPEVIAACNSNNQITKAIYKFNTQTIVDKVNDVRVFAVAADTKFLNITASHQDEIVALKAETHSHAAEINALTTALKKLQKHSIELEGQVATQQTEINALTNNLDRLLTLTSDAIDKIANMNDDGRASAQVHTLTNTSHTDLSTSTTSTTNTITALINRLQSLSHGSNALKKSSQLLMRDLDDDQTASPSLPDGLSPAAVDMVKAVYPNIGVLHVVAFDPQLHCPPQKQINNIREIPTPSLLNNFDSSNFIQAITAIYLARNEKIAYNKECFLISHVAKSLFSCLSRHQQQIFGVSLDHSSSDSLCFQTLLFRQVAHPSSKQGQFNILSLLKFHQMPDTGLEYLNYDNFLLYSDFVHFVEKCIAVWRTKYSDSSRYPTQRQIMEQVIAGLSTKLRSKVEIAYAIALENRRKFVLTDYSYQHNQLVYSSINSYANGKDILFDLINEQAQLLLDKQEADEVEHIAVPPTKVANHTSIYTGMSTDFTSPSLTPTSDLLPHPSSMLVDN